MGRWDEKAQRDAVQSGKGPGEFGPDYSDRKRYQLGYGNESPSPALKKHLEGKKMACSNPECFCVDCECNPCLCREDRPCGCDPNVQAIPPKVGRSRPAGRIQNEWKGLI